MLTDILIRMIRRKFRISCKVALYDFEKKTVLLVEHKRGNYGLPGGHLEFNESPEDAARREIKEELGIDYTDYLVLKDSWVRKNERVILAYVGKLDSSVKLTLDPEEIRSTRWTSINEIHNDRVNITFYKDFILDNA